MKHHDMYKSYYMYVPPEITGGRPILVEFETNPYGLPPTIYGIRFKSDPLLGDVLVRYPLKEAPFPVSPDEGVYLLRLHLNKERKNQQEKEE